jgi:hypothetical protein
VTSETSEFLERATSFNEFNSVRLPASDTSLRLVHPFWTNAAISAALLHRSEWDVPAQFIPFCGDWHTLFCVDSSAQTPNVVMLNDSRAVVHRWESLSAFAASLHSVPEELCDRDLGIIESKSWLKL